MDYEKKYNEALERANMIYNDKYKPEIAAWTKKTLETIFPELKESKDERIKRNIIAALKGEGYYDCDLTNECIAWLEKQGEQKPTDKVDPRFKKGDWIISNNKKSTYQVIEVKRGIYVIRDNVDNHEYHIGIEECEKSGRLWTLQDAKDGDILVCIGKNGQEIGVVKEYIGKYGGCDKCFKTYCFVDWDGIIRAGEYMGSKEIYPATKEQRNLLFQKMEEAGYEWDAEKKELKKTETKGGEE